MVNTDGRMSVNKVGTWWNQLPFDSQMKRLWCWQSQCIKMLGIKRREFLAVYRWEVGRGGREHFHALVKVLKKEKQTRGSMHTIRHVWDTKLEYGHTHARRSNVMANDYITKLLSEYEESRFTGDLRQRHVFFNNAAKKYLS